MPRYRHALPQLSGRIFLTDGGLETTLVFQDGIDLPCFAAFDQMKGTEGVERLRSYFRRYATIARGFRLGFILESPTWRANPDWGARVGLSLAELADVNFRSIGLMQEIREEFDAPRTPIVISGQIGPRGDGYSPDRIMSEAEAEDYHAWQIDLFRKTEADMIAVLTMNYVEEAIGVARAAKIAGMPAAISFTVEVDGRLITGQPLRDAIIQVDEATGNAPAYFMINCAHPTHFADDLAANEPWVGRVRGLRANASRRSHAELDNARDLDAGNPIELGREYRAIVRRLPHINVLGGCCGTDHRHVEAIGRCCTLHGVKAWAA